MKKIISLFAGILLITQVWGQSMNVQSAGNSLKDNDLEAAKDFIDKAAANEQTNNNYKMWYYRAKIYYAIDTSKTRKHLDKDAIEKAAISCLNCIKTDTKGWYTEECKNLVWVTGLGLYNEARDAFYENDFDRANRYYTLIFDIFPLDADKNLKRNNITPEVLYKYLYMVANKAGKKDKAKEYVQKLIDAKFNDANIYIYMSTLYLEEKDTAKAISALEMGTTRFEDNTDLINEEIRIYYAQHKLDVLLDKLSEAIKANPDHELLYANRANLYARKKEFALSEADYKKVLELNENSFDAYYGLGSMYFNQGAEMANAANSISDNKKFEAAKAQADAKLKESLPYFEKAYELKPKDRPTLTALKQIYARTNQTDKYNKIKGELDNLKEEKK